MSVSTRDTAAVEEQNHVWPVRVTHWLMAISVLTMVGSGWRIYNASPIFPFTFPEWATLGGDVEAALARHNDPGVASIAAQSSASSDAATTHDTA